MPRKRGEEQPKRSTMRLHPSLETHRCGLSRRGGSTALTRWQVAHSQGSRLMAADICAGCGANPFACGHTFKPPNKPMRWALFYPLCPHEETEVQREKSPALGHTVSELWSTSSNPSVWLLGGPVPRAKSICSCRSTSITGLAVIGVPPPLQLWLYCLYGKLPKFMDYVDGCLLLSKTH